MGVIIRKSKSQDKEEVLSLVTEFATSFKTENNAFNEAFDEIIINANAELLVAEVNNKVVGYCLGFIHYTFYANGKVSWLEEIMVEENYRSNGIGKSLMKSFEKWAKENNSKLVALATRRAAKFYCGIGYEKSAEYFRKLL